MDDKTKARPSAKMPVVCIKQVRQKSAVGQAQMVLSILILFASITVVLAANSPNTTEKNISLPVWANTSISLNTDQNTATALLIMDNSSPVEGQKISFFLNDSPIGWNVTDREGYALTILPYGFWLLNASFEGNSSLFLNPSEASIWVDIKENAANATKNITQPTTPTEISDTLTIFTDKTNYTLNETVNIFGEIIINGTKINAEANLTLTFNETLVHSALANVTNGSYSYSLIADFENEGFYDVKAFAKNLTNSTRFYYSISNVSENATQKNITAPEIKIEKVEFPASVNISEEFNISAFVTSLNGNSTDVNVSLEIPPEFAASNLSRTIALLEENEISVISWTAKANRCGIYTLNVAAETNGSNDFKSFDILVMCLENVTYNLSIGASLSVVNISDSLKSVLIAGSVNANGSKIASNISLTIKNPKGRAEFHEEKEIDGDFLFNFTFAPKLSGTYAAEINAITDYGSVNKTIKFVILKHKIIKPKIKALKSHFSPGEEIKFEIDVIDEEGNLYPNGTLKVFLTNPEGNVEEIEVEESDIGGKYFVKLTERWFVPGLHKLGVRLTYISPNPGEVVVEEEITFTIGLISINTDKSIYLPGENATVIVGILDYVGQRVSDADLTIFITSPTGIVSTYSTQAGNIANNNDGTYSLNYIPQKAGNYTIDVEAIATNVFVTHSMIFETRDIREFDIIRDAPTVINPTSVITSKLSIIPNVSATAVTIIEKVPKSFEIVTDGMVVETENEKIISWSIGAAEKDREIVVSYKFDAPDAWPKLYKIGPLEILYDGKMFKEARAWEIAADPPKLHVVSTWINGTLVHEPLALCAGKRYSINTTIINVGYDDSDSQSYSIQAAAAGSQFFKDFPALGWSMFSGSNPRTLPVIPKLGLTSTVWEITSTSTPGNYRIKITPAIDDAFVIKETNIQEVKVLNCSAVNLVREIRIFDASGERNTMMPNSISTVAVNLANYKTTAVNNVNVTLTIQEGTETTPGAVQDWYTFENKTQTIDLPGSPSPPPYTNTTLLWHIQPPKNVDTSLDYVVNITIQDEDGVRSIFQNFEMPDYPVKIFNTFPSPIYSGGNGWKKVMTVCNYGDNAIVANITQKWPGVSVNEFVSASPTPDSTTPPNIRWYNQLINTSDCRDYLTVWNRPPAALEDTFKWIQLAEWKEEGISKAVLNAVYIKQDNEGYPSAFAALISGRGYQNVTRGGTASVAVDIQDTLTAPAGKLTTYSKTFAIPPGFNITSVSQSVGPGPKPGFPYGEEEIGRILEYEHSSTVYSVSVLTVTIGTNVADMPKYTPGGKMLRVTHNTNPASEKEFDVIDNDLILRLSGPWNEIERYNNRNGTWTEGFPTELGCGSFNVSLKVFNKGNEILNNANLTEFYPVGLILTNFNPTNSSGNGSQIVWDQLNFTPEGLDSARYFNYTLNVPFGIETNGTFRADVRNASGLIWTDMPFYVSIVCGASLTVSTPTPEPSSPQADAPFNVSSTVSNAGPGSATNVIAIINYTGPLEVRNMTGDISNITFLSTIPKGGSKVAKWNVTGPAGTYTFCIKANATENSTEVAACNDISVTAPPAQILLENPLIISDETQTSTGSWGFNFTFNISMRVAQSDADVTVCSWFSRTGTEPWRQVDSCQVYPAPGGATGPWRNYTFRFDPVCEDVGSPVYAKFNATNFAGTVNSTSTTVTITKDKIIWEYYTGQGETVNRSGSQTTLYNFRVRDLNGTYLPSFATKYYVTTNNVSFYSYSGFEVLTNSSAYANFNFNPSCAGDYVGAPKFLVGEQQWKITVNDSELGCYQQNDSYSSIPRNLFVWGDIRQSITKPKVHTDPLGQGNVTQEESIDFLGFTVDDCGDPLRLNESADSQEVKYFINQTGVAGYNCTQGIETVGSNAYSCTMPTTITTQKGWYNATFYTNKSYHYANYTLKYSDPGLFYIVPVRKLLSPTGIPTTGGWGYPNYNFSVVASSGDPDVTYNVSVMISKIPPPSSADECEAPLCVNQTIVECVYPSCVDSIRTWYRNFSAANFSESSIWYYRFAMNGLESSFDAGTHKVTLVKDNVSVEYYSGNNSVARYDPPASAAELVLRVKDLNRNKYLDSEAAAYVSFEVTTDAANTQWKSVGTNTTNATGYVATYFTPTCDFANGTRIWRGKINTTLDTYYNYNISDTFNVQVLTETCVPNIYITSVKKPSETFQNRSFGINITVQASQGDAENTNATLVVPAGWDVWNGTAWSNVAYLGTISSGFTKDAHWDVKPNSSGSYGLTIYANATMGGSAKSAETSTSASPYKWLQPSSATEPALPRQLAAGENAIAAFSCEAGQYRIANLTATWDGNNTKARVEVYNGTAWIDVLHSYWINTSGAYQSQFVPVLNQLSFNESGSGSSGNCRFRISNVGNNPINITGLKLQGYYSENIFVQDIQAKVGETVTTGLEQSETLFNVSVRIVNSNSIAYSGTIWLNITNSSGILVNYTSQPFYIDADSYNISNFTEINTTLWNPDVYTLRSIITYGSSFAERSEPLIFRNVSLSSKSAPLMCNQTTELYNVSLYHPFTDTVQYNITLQIPSGWSYSPAYQLINASSSGNYTASFNLTSSNAAAETVIINASASYTYPGEKQRKASYTIEENSTAAILEVIRETPSEVANSTEFFSRLIVHNKGCGATSSVSLTEKVSTGWTAYTPTVDAVSKGDADIPAGEVRFSASDFGSIDTGEYRILLYKIFSPSQIDQTGTLRYNLTWDSQNLYEESAHTIKTIKYTNEPHLYFDLTSEGGYKKRSAQPSANQTYNLTVKNSGDMNITANTWNVSLFIPQGCEASNHTGTWNETSRKILWQLGALQKGAETNFTFTMNCTAEAKYLLIAEAVNDTRTQITYVNDTNISCTGASCSSMQSYSFTKPASARYEKMSEIDFYVSQSFTAQNLTIGQGSINISDDYGRQSLVWQNYTLQAGSSKVWSNYSIDESEQENFTALSRNIGLSAYSDATSGQQSNITIEKLAYTWKTGKYFNENQPLFVRVKTYVFVPDPPVLQAPPNGSTQVSSPIVISWFPSAGATNYYVFGDAANGDTYLANVTVTNYLWNLVENGLYKWKVIAAAGAQNSSPSATWQFTLDQCGEDPNYAYAKNYPMSYNLTTDTVTVWGSDGSDGYTAMGNNESNPITFEKIFEFGKATRGICAIIKPATGIYVMKSRLYIGNGTKPTYVVSKGESISFTSLNMPQLTVNASASIAFGSAADGIPQEGSSIKFASNTFNDKLLDVTGGAISFYDSYVTDTGSTWGRFVYTGACGSGENYTTANSSVTIKKTIFDRAARGHFLFTNNVSIDDMKINRINSSAAEGYGIVSGCDLPAMNNLQIYHQEQNGSAVATTANMPNNTDIIVQNSVLDYNTKDVIATGNGRGVQLINTQWDRTYDWNFNSSDGNLNGTVSIKESYGYLPTFVDTSNVPVANLSTIMIDQFGNKQYNFTSNASGLIGEQFIKTWQAEKTTSGESVTSFNPYTVYLKKYAKQFIKELKSFAVRTVETKQIATNIFTTKSENQAGALADITYNEPVKVSYGSESNTTWSTTGLLKNSPVDQCQYFALFANGTKLDEGINYTINYATGEITFLQNVSGYTINPVYYYGGNITVTNGGNLSAAYTMKDIYDYTQYKAARNELFEDVYTLDGITYTFCIDFVVGNSTSQGTISDANSKLAFKHNGYTLKFSGAGGYVDLAGITAGGGAGVTVRLNIQNDVGYNYAPGDTVLLTSYTELSDGTPVNAVINVTIFYPNGTIFTSGLASGTSITGLSRFNITLPSSAPTGTYTIFTNATYASYTVGDTVAFVVSTGTGGAYPTIELSASSPIATLTTANIGALVKTSSGVATNCDGHLNITIRNLADGSSSTGTMTNFGTGMYNYSWNTPASASVFYVNASCAISGTTYTGFTLLSTQPTGATASVDYNQIAVYVWNYNYRNLTWWNTTGIAGEVWNNPVRNLTYYNQSVAESLENCLKNSQCSGWWINTTLAQINTTINLINTSTNNIRNDTEWLRSAFNCSVSNEVCNRLDSISNNTTDIQARVYALNTSQIPAIQLDIDSIQNDTSWIISSQNCTLPAGNTTVCSNLWNILDNTTYIKNNMFYQSNATSAFIVKPLATVYTEPGSTAELFVLTYDLLGNQKNVTASSCNITRSAAFISAATTTNNPGYVYANWSVPSSQSAGEYYWNCTLTGSTVSLGVPFYIANTTQILAAQYEITMSDFAEVLAGKDYMARIRIKDYLGRPANADSPPKITLYNPERNIIVQNVSMTWEETGVYRYNYTTPSSGATFGVWEAVVYVTVNGITSQYNDYWELEGAPAEVKINAITDNTVPTITASVTVTNEGSVGAEYPYEYCIVSEQTNVCGGGDDQAYASGAKYIDAGQAWNTQLTLSIPQTGNYWFKMVVYWGTERSGASRSFTAVAEEVAPAPAPAPAPYVAPPAVGRINISEYPKEMKVGQGSVEFYAVKVKNIGSGKLNNITLSIDLPTWMHSIVPDSLAELQPGQDNAFVIKVKAPLDAEPRQYAYRIKAKSNEDEQSVYGILNVLERNITVPFLVFDVQIATPRLYLNAEGKLKTFIENVGDKELKVTGKLLLPKGWVAKESEVIKILPAKSNTSIEFTVIPTTFGLNNITLEMSYDGQKVQKNILVNVEVPLKVPEIAIPWEWVALLIVAVAVGVIIIKKREERIYRSELRDIKKHITVRKSLE